VRYAFWGVLRFRLGIILLLLLSDGVEVVLRLLLRYGRGSVLRSKIVDRVVGQLRLGARLRVWIIIHTVAQIIQSLTHLTESHGLAASEVCQGLLDKVHGATKYMALGGLSLLPIVFVALGWKKNGSAFIGNGSASIGAAGGVNDASFAVVHFGTASFAVVHLGTAFAFHIGWIICIGRIIRY
jgi:hypothetical protein